MAVVAIISEYNPFHTGHEYHIKRIREDFGEDTSVISIMSGNYTQRGELAVLPKGDRAKMALHGGADLVLELPFPYSMSSAELFATSGVSIANSLGIVDYISFGSESGDVDELFRAAQIMDSSEFKERFSKIPSSVGYPERCEMAYRAIANDSLFTFSSNNILAIEYIRALHALKSTIKVHTIKREGAAYTADSIEASAHQSAMAIRTAISNGDAVSAHIPACSYKVLADAMDKGDFVTSQDNLSYAVISYFRLNPPTQDIVYHDAADGLYNRLYKNSFEASSISELLELSETKNYTRARIRRCMWNSFFGVTSSDVKEMPAYTQVLAMNKIGMLLLKNVWLCEGFSVLTKPSDCKNFSEMQIKQKNLSDRADSIYELAKSMPKSGKSALKFTPFVKK